MAPVTESRVDEQTVNDCVLAILRHSYLHVIKSTLLGFCCIINYLFPDTHHGRVHARGQGRNSPSNHAQLSCHHLVSMVLSFRYLLAASRVLFRVESSKTRRRIDFIE